MAKGLTMIAHGYTPLEAEVRSLRAANKALSKRRRAKKHAFVMEKRLV